MNVIKMAGIELIELVNEPIAATKQYIENLKNNPEFVEEENLDKSYDEIEAEIKKEVAELIRKGADEV